MGRHVIRVLAICCGALAAPLTTGDRAVARPATGDRAVARPATGDTPPGGQGAAPTMVARLANFATDRIDPNRGQTDRLPVVSLGCHQIGQIYVLSQACLDSQATTRAEAYAFSLGLANNDTGAGAPAPGSPGAGGTDKVTFYAALDENSGRSNGWVQNLLAWQRAGGGQTALSEMDLDRARTCRQAVGAAWIGSGCPAGIGLWITGVPVGGEPGGPAVTVLSVAAPLWTDGFEIPGNAVRDNGFLDASSAAVSVHVAGVHDIGVDIQGRATVGLDMSTATLAQAAIRLRAGDARQTIAWVGANGAAVDTIAERSGAGLTIAAPDVSFTGDVVSSRLAVRTSIAMPAAHGAAAPLLTTGATGDLALSTGLVAAGSVSARYVAGSGGDGIVATGRTQATARVLLCQLCGVTNVAAGSGVELSPDVPVGAAGGVRVFNRGAHALRVYAPGGEVIEGQPAGAAASVAAGADRTFYRTSATQWRV